jgi:hypothetical protein
VASSKTKAVPPSKVDVARVEFEKIRREYNDLRKPGVKCTQKQKSVAAAKYRAASLVIEAELAQRNAAEAVVRAEEAMKDVETAEAAK